MFGRLQKMLLATTALVPLGLTPANANPQGAQVVGGAATVQGQGTASVVVQQSTDKAIINWNTFNIGANEKTRFIQPSSSAVALNRVTGGLGPSQIYGALSANGRIFVVNPDGILIGPGAKIDTAGFLATTHDIANADFMAGRYNFTIPGNPSASVVNEGTITAQTGGFAALVAPGVRNSGTITARLGDITLASGNAFSLDFYGDKLITLGVSDSIAAQVKDVSTGQPLASLVSNAGKLKANGGTVELTAVAARQVVDSVINNTGVIEANSIGSHNGMIVLSAATAASKPVDAPTQTVKVSGKLLAAGKKKSTKGGTIEVTGETVALTGAALDASGRAGGGTVLIGGDVGGGNPNPAVVSIPQAQLQPYAVPTASTVTVDAATTINASAKDTGGGGKVAVWADQFTSFAGLINATGGALGGNGGYVETSGHLLDFAGARVNTAAPNGLTGSWLLDPYDLTIDAGAAATIATSLATTNVTLQTTASGSSGPGVSNPSGNGDIFVNSAISWNSGNSLTLSAYRNIDINAAITGASGGLSLHAGTDQIIRAAAAVQVHTFTLQNGDWFQVTNNLPIFSATDFRVTGGSFMRALGGDGSSGSPFQISDIYGLQGIASSSLSGLGLQHLVFSNYVLANNIAAAGTAQWNSGAGFVPIGYGGFDPPYTTFGGIFDGQGHTIDGLTINSSATVGSIGMFAGNDGTIRNLNLTNISFAINDAAYAGGLVGDNIGTISNASVSGTLQVGNFTGSNSIASFANAGGLVGINAGSISVSSSSGLLTGSASGDSVKGGLVGQNTWIEYFDINGNITSTVIGTISNSSSSMNVQGLATGSIVGGLVGVNSGIISQSSASGAVTTAGGGFQSQGGPFIIGGQGGGLVGLNYNLSPPDVGLISNSSATGSVTGGPNSQLGPLVGLNYGGTITNSTSSSSTSTQSASAAGAQLFGQINNLTQPNMQIAGPTTAPVITNLNTVQSTPTVSTPATQPTNNSTQPSLNMPSGNVSAGLNHFIAVLKSPTGDVNVAELAKSIVDLALNIKTLSDLQSTIDKLNQLGIKVPTDTENAFKLSFANLGVGAVKTIFDALIGTTISYLNTHGHSYPVAVVQSMADSVYNAATLPIIGPQAVVNEIQDQVTLIAHEYAGLKEDSGSLVNLIVDSGAKNLARLQSIISDKNLTQLQKDAALRLEDSTIQTNAIIAGDLKNSIWLLQREAASQIQLVNNVLQISELQIQGKATVSEIVAAKQLAKNLDQQQYLQSQATVDKTKYQTFVEAIAQHYGISGWDVTP